MSAIMLIQSGIAMGFVHVLTGPDHLSALATLSSNTDKLQAFVCGVRWGIGHSSGLIVVGSILIAFSSEEGFDVPQGLETILETFVGIFMCFLGIWGLTTAYRRERDMEESNDIDSNLERTDNDEMGHGIMLMENEKLSNCTILREERLGIEVDDPYSISMNAFAITDHSRETLSSSVNELEGRLGLGFSNWSSQENSPSSDTGGRHVSYTSHKLGCPVENFTCIISLLCPLPICKLALHRCMECNCSKQILSLWAGLVHGAAGPGGVLGVIPAVQLHDWKLSVLYLGTFCATSTLVMGFYSTLYGTCSTIVSKNGAHFEFRMAVFSSSLSIIVGFLWLVLLSIGKLHDVFP